MSNKDLARKARLIEALAAELASKAERGGAWPGEMDDSLRMIRSATSEAQQLVNSQRGGAR